MNRIPNGYFSDNCSVWVETNGEYVIAKGWNVEFPDLSTSDAEQWLNLEAALRQILGSLSDSERMQVTLRTGSELFSPALDRYDKRTAECSIGICKDMRTELSGYFRGRIDNHTLINVSVQIHLSTKIKSKTRAFEEVFSVTKRNLDGRGSYIDMVLRGLGGATSEIDSIGHYKDMLQYWSPGSTPVKDPDLYLPIEELCRHSELAPLVGKESAHGFYLNGYYLGVWVIKQMPRSTWQKTMENLSNLTMPGLRVALNITKLSVAHEEEHDEHRDEILAKNPSKLRAVGGRLKHLDRIIRMQKNEISPFSAQLIILVSAKSPLLLDDKMTAVHAAIDHTGCQAFNSALPASTVALFNCATPGYGPWTGYKPYWLNIDDLNLAHMSPVGSTPMAQLSEADWIMCGNRDNLIGGCFFIGSQPADMVVMGTKGAGKSATLQSLFLQAADQFGFIGLIDEHFSWIETARLLDPSSRPIVIRSNSLVTFNLFDTKRAALSPQHKRSAISLAQLLAGKSENADRNMDQAAILSKTINSIYDREFRYWRKDHPTEHYQACRTATLALRTIGEDFVDAVQWLKELKERTPEKYQELDNTLTEEDSIKTERNRETAHFVRDAAFATWTPDMFPTLFHLWEELNSQRIQKGASPLYEPLTNHIERWLASGEFGPIVDGVSNIDLGTKYVTENSPLKVVHFELGEMRKSEEELKHVLGFLITNEMRAVVQTMPRRIKKAVIIEEMTSLLRVPNAAEIVIDYSERMRKFNCWLAYVFQQYSGLLKANKAVAEAIVGNSLSMMLLMNKNREDVMALDSYIRIPEPVQQAIQQFPPPESMRGRADAYAGCVYVDKSGTKPVFTIGRTMMSQRMEDITNSSGDRFDQKRKELAA